MYYVFSPHLYKFRSSILFRRMSRYILRTHDKPLVDRMIQAKYQHLTIIDIDSQPEVEVSVYQHGDLRYSVFFELDEYKYRISKDQWLNSKLQAYFKQEFLEEWAMIADELHSEQEVTQHLDEHMGYLQESEQTELYQMWHEMQS